MLCIYSVLVINHHGQYSCLQVGLVDPKSLAMGSPFSGVAPLLIMFSGSSLLKELKTTATKK